jgi:hypothetical protein
MPFRLTDTDTQLVLSAGGRDRITVSARREVEGGGVMPRNMRRGAEKTLEGLCPTQAETGHPPFFTNAREDRALGRT